MRIYLIGFMGCGKTHWGREMSRKLQVPFFDLDSVIEEKEGKAITAIFAEMGEEYFRMLEKDVLYMLTESHENFVMATGGGTPCFFNNIDYMKSRGTTIWINSSVDTLHNRLVKEKAQRPLVASISDADLRSFIIRKYSDRKIFYQQANVILNEDDLTLGKLIETTFHA
ncbi:shikimate kinase [Flavisolibacter nicotianae]|uniref:shikimate kinase n=1 Tax=Flavisolibacter nicotianae TaxID=2364882 RepID=UPI000EAFEFB3|nr:shikimate kinase [Flavisolibacter nicotianae]